MGGPDRLPFPQFQKCRLNSLNHHAKAGQPWPRMGAAASPSSGALGCCSGAVVRCGVWRCGGPRRVRCARVLPRFVLLEGACLTGTGPLACARALPAWRAGRKTGREESPREEADIVQSTPALVSSGFKRRQAQRAAQVRARRRTPRAPAAKPRRVLCGRARAALVGLCLGCRPRSAAC